jgi:hypothetical protein
MSRTMRPGNKSLGRMPGWANLWTGSRSTEEMPRLRQASVMGVTRFPLIRCCRDSTEYLWSPSTRRRKAWVACNDRVRTWLRSNNFWTWRWIGGMPASVSAAPLGLVKHYPIKGLPESSLAVLAMKALISTWHNVKVSWRLKPYFPFIQRLSYQKKTSFFPPDPNCPNFVISSLQMGEIYGNLSYSTHSHPQNLP